MVVRIPCLNAFAAVLSAATLIHAETWRIGDAAHPWRLHPVSFVLVTGEAFRPQFDWGGSFAVEIIVDDDGDGLIDEDPVDIIDNDGDFLWNEDPVDGIDNDFDGLIDEDGPDPQQDNDGDGLINEDGLHTGGPIYSPAVRRDYTGTPFFRYATAAEASADAQGWGSGYGWGDDDADGRFNEDPVNGVDDDGDGLIDEDDAAPDSDLPPTWFRPVLAYDTEGLTIEQRQDLRFVAVGDGTYRAVTGAGDEVIATFVNRAFRPTDWIRSIRLDSTRNVARLVDDRFLAGLLSEQDPLQLGEQVGTPRRGDSGNGQVVDGNISTAKSVVGNWSFGTRLNGLFWIDRIRYYPRPNFIEHNQVGVAPCVPDVRLEAPVARRPAQFTLLGSDHQRTQLWQSDIPATEQIDHAQRRAGFPAAGFAQDQQRPTNRAVSQLLNRDSQLGVDLAPNALRLLGRRVGCPIPRQHAAILSQLRRRRFRRTCPA